jgi:hypothetical protein
MQGAPHRKRLGDMGGALGRRCALSVGVWSVASVSHWFGHNAGSFRVVASKTVRGAVVSVG